MSTDKKAEAIRLCKQGVSKTEISRRTGLARNTVIKYTRDILDEVAAEREKRIVHLATERELLKAVKGERSFRSFLGDLISDVARPFTPPPVPKLPAASKRKHERFPLLHLSDWHFEETVRPQAVLGLNEYSIPTACRRAYRIVQSARHWHRTYSNTFRCPSLKVALNGDMITGTLHGLERHTGARNVAQAAIQCGTLIACALRDLAAEWPELSVDGTVGNHGRLPDDKKTPTKDPTRSWDWIAYRFAQALLRDCQNIKWNLPESYGSLYEVGGHLCYQGHGHDLKQQLGIVGYGMRRFGANLSAALSAAGKQLKYLFFGHFHASNSAEFAGVETFIGPSLIGTQEHFFLQQGATSRPGQQLHVIDRDLGHISRDMLCGDGPGYEGAYLLAA